MANDAVIPDGKAATLEAAPGVLPRVLGFWDIVGIVVGSVIGSGIFIVPASVAAGLHSPQLILLVWVVGGILCYFGAVTFAELGTAFPSAGGMYIYLREAYGPLIAFLFGWTLFLVIDTGSVATLAVAFSTTYLRYFFPISPWLAKVIAILFVVFLAAVNFYGTKSGAYLQNFLTLIKFGAILAVCVIVLGFVRGNTGNFVSPPAEPLSWNLISRIGIALVAIFWAYKGWEQSSYSAGELKNPERNFPSGLFLSMGLVIFLYILTNLAYLYAFPADVIAKSSRIASDAMDLATPMGGTIIAITILFSITGAANSNMLCSPRVFFAMAGDGLFFKKIAAVHPRFRTPHVSIVAMAVWAVVLTLLFETFEQLFTYVVFGQWVFFGLTAAAVIILRRKRPDIPRPYKTWGYPITPLIFIASAFLISVNTLINEFWNAFAGLAIILLGVPAYLYWSRKKDKATT